jgi:inner membrane transporter RhtA
LAPIRADAEGMPDTPAPRNLLRGTATMLVGAGSSQIGAALAVNAFSAIGPVGVVAVRQVVAAAVLMPVARPPVRRLTRAQWWPVLLLAVVFATMNLCLYTAVERLGLGLAVTLEFLGPLAVALYASRTRTDALVALAAAAGVYVLVMPSPSSDWLGVGLGLTAAACWAAYILLNRTAGARLTGLQAPALASTLSGIASLPVLVVLAAQDRLWGPALAWAAVAGLLASVVPYAADLTALRYVPARFFAVFMSAHPALAALAGLVLLDQQLARHEWTGIGVVVLANALAVTLHDRLTTAPARAAGAAAPVGGSPTVRCPASVPGS